MPKAVVLGAGMVGSVMAEELSRQSDFSVAIADVRSEALQAASQRCGGRVETLRADLSEPTAVAALVKPYDIVLGALSSRLGFQTLKTVINAGKNYCDISFMPENAWELDEFAKQQNVTAVVDCGVAPGMSNLLAGFGVATLQKTERIEIYVGGVPRHPSWPFQYKAAFSPRDVIEEYTRPARLVENGTIITREALSEPELLHFDGVDGGSGELAGEFVGGLEAFNTDGLRSLIHTMRHRVPHMKEKTLRYPGHIELMRVFRHMGLFSDQPMKVGEVSVKPVDLTAALMFPLWTYEPQEEDLTVMRVIVEGVDNRGAPRRLIWELNDAFDRKTSTTSMSRTTAIPCTIIACMIARGELKPPLVDHGVIPPEVLGPVPGLLDHVLREHQRCGIKYSMRCD